MGSSFSVIKYSVVIIFFPSFIISPSQDELKASVERGKKIYENTCLPCHQADGKGVPGMNPPLVKTTWVLGDKEKLVNILLNGFDEDVEIDGERFSNTMPPQSFLKDQEMADVLTYIRNSFGNKASAITVTEVKKWKNK